MVGDGRVMLRDNAGVEVGQHSNRVLFGQLDAHGIGRAFVEGHVDRPPAAGRDAGGLLKEQARLDQLADNAGDRGLAQVRACGDLGARKCAVAADGIEHNRLVDLTDEMFGPRAHS